MNLFVICSATHGCTLINVGPNLNNSYFLLVCLFLFLSFYISLSFFVNQFAPERLCFSIVLFYISIAYTRVNDEK